MPCGWQPRDEPVAGVWEQRQRMLLDWTRLDWWAGGARLVARERGLGQCPGEQGGTQTGPHLTDRSRPGTKRSLLAIRRSAANVPDTVLREVVRDAVPPLKGRWGRPPNRPATLHANKAYDSPAAARPAAGAA